MVPSDNLHIYALLCLKLSLGYSSYQYNVSGVNSCHCFGSTLKCTCRLHGVLVKETALGFCLLQRVKS